MLSSRPERPIDHRNGSLPQDSTLVTVDEVGVCPLDRMEVNVLFRMISEWCERASIVVTTNRYVRSHSRPHRGSRAALRSSGWLGRMSPTVFRFEAIASTSSREESRPHVHVQYATARQTSGSIQNWLWLTTTA